MNHDYQAIEKKARTRRTVLRTITYINLTFSKNKVQYM